jgi:hypothetical protein
LIRFNKREKNINSVSTVEILHLSCSLVQTLRRPHLPQHITKIHASSNRYLIRELHSAPPPSNHDLLAYAPIYKLFRDRCKDEFGHITIVN